MKLLFDQNISFRVVNKLKYIFSESEQVRRLNLEGASDLEIWKYAKKHSFTIVTFDSNFSDLCLVKGIPPKVIWLRIGNTITNNIIKLLEVKKDVIIDFCNSDEAKYIGCLEITEHFQ